MAPAAPRSLPDVQRARRSCRSSGNAGRAPSARSTARSRATATSAIRRCSSSCRSWPTRARSSATRRSGRSFIGRRSRAQQMQRGILRDLVDRAFGGSPASLIVQALADRRSTAEERRQIRELLDRLDARDVMTIAVLGWAVVHSTWQWTLIAGVTVARGQPRPRSQGGAAVTRSRAPGWRRC